MNKLFDRALQECDAAMKQGLKAVAAAGRERDGDHR